MHCTAIRESTAHRGLRGRSLLLLLQITCGMRRKHSSRWHLLVGKIYSTYRSVTYGTVG